MQKELDVIMDLMKDLQDKMQYGKDDFSERLGRGKPDLEVAKISVDPEDQMDGGADDAEEEGDQQTHGMEDGWHGDEEDPEEKFKNRLMRLRG